MTALRGLVLNDATGFKGLSGVRRGLTCAAGNLLLTGEERAVIAEKERDRATGRAEKAEQFQKDAVSRLAKMGLTPEKIAEALGLSIGAVRAIVTDTHPGGAGFV